MKLPLMAADKLYHLELEHEKTQFACAYLSIYDLWKEVITSSHVGALRSSSSVKKDRT